MFYVLQNESTAARRRVPILLTDAATGTTAQTGVATTTIFPYVNINGGAFAGGAGTIAEAGYGQYYYEFDVAEVATLGLAGIHITAAGCRDYDAISQVAALNFYSASVGASAYDVWAFDYNSAGVVAGSSAERLEETRTEAFGANNAATNAETNTTNIALQVWGDDLGVGANSPYAAGTGGTILYGLSLGGGGGITAFDVWNYTLGSSLSADATITQIDSNISVLPANTASQTWSYFLPNSISAEDNLVTAASGAGISAGDVWDYAGGRTITGGIADTVTTLTNRSGFAITGGTITTVSDKTGYSLSGTQTFNVTGNITGNLSGSVGSVTGAVGSVTGNVGGNVVGSVASVTAAVTFNSAQYAGIASSVWNAATRTLTSAGAGLTAGDVWDYAGGRTITGGIADTVTTLTNRSGFAITGGTITTVSDKTGYSLSGTQAFNLTGNITGNLSGSVGSVSGAVGSVTGAVGSVTGAVGSVTGSVASVVGNVGGNVVGSVASVSGAVGSVTGAVGSVTGNVGGNVVGSVASVTAAVSVATASMSGIANTVWSTNISGYTSPSAGYSLYNASAGGGISAGDVWSYATRTITGGIADTVTTLTNRSGFAITGGTITTVSDKTGYSLSSTQTFNLTGNITGNLSGSVGSVTGAVGSVTGSVASVTNPVTFNSAQYAGIASSVWNAATRTLTSGGSGISAFDVWNFVLSDTNTAEVDLVTAAGGAGITAGDVWTYATRTITGGIADTVTTVSNGVIVTTNNDKTGYSLSGTQSFNLTGNITGNLSGSVASVTNPVTFNSAQYAGIASSVWNAATRTLTSGGGITAGDVWTYSPRTLTSGAGITVNAATNIINGPYFVKSNVDGQDGNLDVIRGMVQDIQLTVTDAFQNPFDVTALGLAVNFYDQAGTLVTSYGTSNLYAPAGLVQFTLDTAVTGNEGRYNLILSAAGSGNTIKFGPLTTLVRPF